MVMLVCATSGYHFWSSPLNSHPSRLRVRADGQHRKSWVRKKTLSQFLTLAAHSHLKVISTPLRWPLSRLELRSIINTTEILNSLCIDFHGQDPVLVKKERQFGYIHCPRGWSPPDSFTQSRCTFHRKSNRGLLGTRPQTQAYLQGSCRNTIEDVSTHSLWPLLIVNGALKWSRVVFPCDWGTAILLRSSLLYHAVDHYTSSQWILISL